MTPIPDIEHLEGLRDNPPPDAEPEVKTAWVNYMNARIEKVKNDKER